MITVSIQKSFLFLLFKKKQIFWSHFLYLVNTSFLDFLSQQNSSRDLIYTHFLQFLFGFLLVKSILIRFCPLKLFSSVLPLTWILINRSAALDTNCHASFLKYVSTLGSQDTSHWFSSSPLQSLLVLFAFSSWFSPLWQDPRAPQGSVLVPFLFSICVHPLSWGSSKLRASNHIYLPLTLKFLCPAHIYFLISYSCIQLSA